MLIEAIQFILAKTQAQFNDAKMLFQEYAASLYFDLSFQQFEKELITITEQYSPPHGALLLCYYQGVAIGCVGIRKLFETTAELKRLFVKPQYRSLKIGKQLLQSGIDIATRLKYHYIRLDTVPGQEKAQALYTHLGFYVIEPYRHNPVEGTIYMEKKLAD